MKWSNSFEVKSCACRPLPILRISDYLGIYFRLISNYLHKKPCQVFAAPFDVRLSLPVALQTADKITTVVQPDISIICDSSKIDEKGCQGAPDWIIEILSKSTAQKDLTDKYDLYQHAGVQEYWVIHPHEATVLVYRLSADGQYQLLRQTPFVRHELLPSGIFPDFQVPLEEVFWEG